MKNGLSTVNLLLLTVVLVCAVLGALSTAAASSDLRRAQKQAEYAAAIQDCENRAQDWLAEISAEEENTSGSFEKEFTDGEGHKLSAKILVEGGKITVLRWETSTEWTDERALGSLVKINREQEETP